jgi:hypothetical protein
MNEDDMPGDDIIELTDDDLAWTRDTWTDGELDAWFNTDTNSPPDDTWQPISLRHDPNRPHIHPTILRRDDGQALFTLGHVHVLFGEPEAGKGWILCHAITETVHAGQNVIYIDLEDTEQNIGPRLRALGLTDNQLDTHVTYLRPQERTTPTSWDRLCTYARDAQLVIIDSFNEVIGLWGLKSKDNDEITPFVRNVPRALAHLGPAVILADHVVKNREDRGRYPIGAQAKLAAADAGYYIDNTSRFGRGKTGRSTINVAKDRHGHVRANTVGEDHWGTFTLTSNPDGDQVTVELVTKISGDGRQAWRPTHLMEKVSRLLEANTDGLSQRAIVKAIGGKTDHVRAAIDVLVNEGYCTTAKGPRNADLTVTARPYREAVDNASDPGETDDHTTAPRPRPTAPRDAVTTTAPTAPTAPTNGRGARGAVTPQSDTPPRPLCHECGHHLERGGWCPWCHPPHTTDEWIGT